MALLLQAIELGALPGVTWRWEPETDILAGVIEPHRAGAAGSLELSGHDGAVVVVDLADGVIAGLDVVVWPEVTTVDGLTPPVPVRAAAVRVGAGQGARAGATAEELEVALAVRVSPAEDVIHVRVGAPRPGVPIRLADHLLVELDDTGGLAGFWLTAVPPLAPADSQG